MPSFNSHELLTDLHRKVSQNIIDVRAFAALPSYILLKQPAPGSWSVAQVIEHLNVYNRFYLKAIGERLLEGSKLKDTFRPGWLGNYFTGLMQPGQNGYPVKPMSAPANAQPDVVLDGKAVLDEYLAGQSRLEKLLQNAMDADLDIRVPTSLSSLVQLKMGDTFRFLVAHQARHTAQMKRALAAVQRPQLA